MKRITLRWIPAVLLLSISMQVSAQTVSADYYNRLFYLCKAWGHAKYFHTEIAKGTINWDDQLITAITRTKAATSDTEFSSALLLMLNSAGPMGTSTATLPSVPDELNNNADHSWIDQPVFSAEVKAKLNEILTKFRPQSNYYVGQAFASGNPTFDTDNLYFAGDNYPAEEIRLLALFRYWNIINYFFPYKNLIDRNWDGVLAEFIPRMSEAPNELEFHLALKEMTTRINDSHGGFSSPVYSAWVGGYSPPFLVRYIDNEMVVTRVLPETANVAKGDVLKEIDGLDVYQLRNDFRKYGSGSNGPAIEKSLNNMIVYGNTGTSTVTVFNGNSTRTESFERNAENAANLKFNDTPVWKTTIVGGCTFGIVDMERLETTQVATMFTELWNTGAIIFDIRNYPLGTLWYLVNYLFTGSIHIADFTVPRITYPGSLEWKSTYIGTGTTNPYRGKIILLFDERTISQAEYTCMGLELFPDAIKIGSQTAGADGNVSKIYLTSNTYTIMTGLGTFYGDRTPTQRVGIVPDYEVHPTIAGIREGRDELMEFALNPALLNVHPGYCTSAGKATTEWISTVTLGTNTNSSGSTGTIGYQLFTFPVFTVESGKSYTIQLKPGYAKAAYENWSVWIDYNGDQGFDEPGEMVFSKARSKTTVSGTIVIPAGLSLTTRMRISMSSAVMPGPCSMLTTGEVEDYTLMISPPPPDPLVADFMASPVEPVVGSSVQFTDLSTGNPTSWSWYFPGGYPPQAIEQNPSVTYSVPGTYDVTLYVTRADETSGVMKAGYIVAREIVNNQYCLPDQINSTADYIKSVSITGVLQNTTAGTGYSLYPSTIAINSGKSYPVTLTPNNSTIRNYWKIWIDFNGDGDFLDNGESVFTATNKKGTISSSLVIPAGSSGSTRMRISMRSGVAPQPCDDNFTGEVEDYDILLGPSGLQSYRESVHPLLLFGFENQVSVYPNPVSGDLNILVNELSDQNNLDIFSLDGKVLHKSPVTSNLTRIDVSRWDSGIYLIRLTCGGIIINRKFVKE